MNEENQPLPSPTSIWGSQNFNISTCFSKSQYKSGRIKFLEISKQKDKQELANYMQYLSDEIELSRMNIQNENDTQL